MDLGLIKKHEGLRLKAYLCPAGVPTIGYGNTFYEDGSKVKMGDAITRERAEKMLFHTVMSFQTQVRAVVTSNITPNQLSALTSFAYNVGMAALRPSTLLKMVNTNPNDSAIRWEFAKWNKANGVMLPGLVNRRRDEADLYFKK